MLPKSQKRVTPCARPLCRYDGSDIRLPTAALYPIAKQILKPIFPPTAQREDQCTRTQQQPRQRPRPKYELVSYCEPTRQTQNTHSNAPRSWKQHRGKKRINWAGLSTSDRIGSMTDATRTAATPCHATPLLTRHDNLIDGNHGSHILGIGQEKSLPPTKPFSVQERPRHNTVHRACNPLPTRNRWRFPRIEVPTPPTCHRSCISDRPPRPLNPPLG